MYVAIVHIIAFSLIEKTQQRDCYWVTCLVNAGRSFPADALRRFDLSNLGRQICGSFVLDETFGPLLLLRL